MDFLLSGGHIANHRQCVGDDGGGGGGGVGVEDCCPPVWDGFLCWPPAPANCVVEQSCPANIPQLNQHSKSVRKRGETTEFWEYHSTVLPFRDSSMENSIQYSVFHNFYTNDQLESTIISVILTNLNNFLTNLKE